MANLLRDMTTHELIAELGRLTDAIRQSRVPRAAAGARQPDSASTSPVDDITVLVAREHKVLHELRLRRNATRQVMAWYRRRDERRVRTPFSRSNNVLSSR